MTKTPKPRRMKTHFPTPDPSIRIKEIVVIADSAVGPVTHHQTFSQTLQPGDSIQFTWNYKGVGLE